MLMDTNGHTILSEDYVSYEVAKLLKEKGFDAPCRSYYIDYEDYIDFSYCNDELTDLQMGVWETLRPTHQMAMKWLRDVHGLSVETFSIKGTSNICPVFWKSNVVKLLTQDRAFNGELVDSYEEAIEAALKYSLENLI